MKNIMKNNVRIDSQDKVHGGFHKVISGHTKENLEAEDLEIYRFVIGGMQAK